MSILITDKERKRIAESRLRRKSIRLVHDCQGERPQPLYHARLQDQLDRFKAVKSGLDNGYSAADIRRYECERSIGIIRSEAQLLAVIETPTFAANALRKLADEIENGDAA